MTDLLETGAQWLGEKLKACASRPVVYRRGSDEVTVEAIVGRTLLKLDDGYGGVRVEWTDRDFLIAAEDLILGGQTTLPRRGDQIRETRDGKTLIYEVLAPGGEPEWRWSDPHRRRLNHTGLRLSVDRTRPMRLGRMPLNAAGFRASRPCLRWRVLPAAV